MNYIINGVLLLIVSVCIRKTGIAKYIKSRKRNKLNKEFGNMYNWDFRKIGW